MGESFRSFLRFSFFRGAGSGGLRHAPRKKTTPKKHKRLLQYHFRKKTEPARPQNQPGLGPFPLTKPTHPPRLIPRFLENPRGRARFKQM